MLRSFENEEDSRVGRRRGGADTSISEVILVGERAVMTIGLYVRIPPSLHARVKGVAADREETVTAFVRRALSHELQQLRTGKVVAQAIRNGSSGPGLGHSIFSTEE